MSDPTLSNPALTALYNQLNNAVREAPTLYLKLRVAAENVVQIATALAEQSEFLLDEFAPQVINVQSFQEFVQQSQFVDLDEWVEEINWTRSSVTSEDLPEEQMDDEQLTAFLQISQEVLEHPQLDSAEGIWSIAHAEDAVNWSDQIFQYLLKSNSPISLLELSQQLKMPLVSVWLGGLLSDSIHLFQETECADEHEFYEIDIFAAVSEK